MTLAEIGANADCRMTADLIRLFRAAGCTPTLCHACGRRLLAGAVFKLVPHQKPGRPLTDEMCCEKCGEHQLVLRDKREAKRSQSSIPRRSDFGGYSRPSLTVEQKP